MIYELELQAFKQRIEEKIPTLTGKALDNANDSVNLINMVTVELRDNYRTIWELNRAVDQVTIREMKEIKENLDLKFKIKQLEKDIATLKENIADGIG